MMALFVRRVGKPVVSKKELEPVARVYKAREVFTPHDIPTVTYIDRAKSTEGKNIRYHVCDEGGLVNVFGGSKIGKTALCTKLLEDRQAIDMHGPHLTSGDVFWRILSRRLGLAD